MQNIEELNKSEIKQELQSRDLDYEDSMTKDELKEVLKQQINWEAKQESEASDEAETNEEPEHESTVEDTQNETTEQTNQDESTEQANEKTYTESDVQRLIERALERYADSSQKKKTKKRGNNDDFFVHLHRIDGKWVVDFVDHQKDEYINEPQFAFEVYNPSKREDESWVELVLDDGTRKQMLISQYVRNRVSIFCKVIQKQPIDKSYSIGEVEEKKIVGDKLVPTGRMVDQTVNVTNYKYTVELPKDKKHITVPDYVIA